MDDFTFNSIHFSSLTFASVCFFTELKYNFINISLSYSAACVYTKNVGKRFTAYTFFSPFPFYLKVKIFPKKKQYEKLRKIKNKNRQKEKGEDERED